jgi:hypothetical protein
MGDGRRDVAERSDSNVTKREHFGSPRVLDVIKDGEGQFASSVAIFADGVHGMKIEIRIITFAPVDRIICIIAGF